MGKQQTFANTAAASALSQWMESRVLTFEDLSRLCRKRGWRKCNWKSLENIAYGNKRVHWNKCLILERVSEGLVPAAQIIAFFDLRRGGTGRQAA